MTNLTSVFSSADDLARIAESLRCYTRLPFHSGSIPGAIMEKVLADVRGGTVLQTYDFVDVIDPDSKIGWQVKSTRLATPVTWKRAKIPNAAELIEASLANQEALQSLGDAIISFCNHHAQESLEKYDLAEIGYARLIINGDSNAQYFEKIICDESNPQVFRADQFQWKWSSPKVTVRKEQLPALHGIDRVTNEKWFAWHGRGENQLHFSGERAWWPGEDSDHTISFPTGFNDQISLEYLVELMSHSAAT